MIVAPALRGRTRARVYQPKMCPAGHGANEGGDLDVVARDAASCKVGTHCARRHCARRRALRRAATWDHDSNPATACVAWIDLRGWTVRRDRMEPARAIGRAWRACAGRSPAAANAATLAWTECPARQLRQSASGTATGRVSPSIRARRLRRSGGRWCGATEPMSPSSRTAAWWPPRSTAADLAAERGLEPARWSICAHCSPLDFDAVAASVQRTGRAVVMHEGSPEPWASGPSWQLGSPRSASTTLRRPCCVPAG